jgi:hypothetical protein
VIKGVLLGLATILGLAAVAVGAVGDLPALIIIGVVVTQLADTAVIRTPEIRSLLGQGQLGIAARSLIRELLVVTALLSIRWASATTRHEAVVLLLGFLTLRLLSLLLSPLATRAAGPPTRNIDLSSLGLPPTPPPWLINQPSERQHLVSFVVVLAAACGIAAHSAWPLVVVGLGVALEAGAVAVLVSRVFRRGIAGLYRATVMPMVRERILALEPEVILFHSGEPESVYQVNMWLQTVDRLSRRVLVVLRERSCFDRLADTSSPVVCLTDPLDVMALQLPLARVALYTANVGKTIHLLREPDIRHVFIGHGDSDKSASFNPFSKVYSEIWVAGPVGRERYRDADVGVDDADIVEVGRPQLAEIQHASLPQDGRPLVVLYAPTWEGWVDDPTSFSVVTTGLVLVERLLALDDVRVIYKPHPLIGRVSAAARAADQAIRHAIAGSARQGDRAAGPAESLFELFNAADVLVADVSSVLTDFLASAKPYVVTNLLGVAPEELRAAFPSTAAAYLLDPQASQIETLLQLVRTEDPMRGRRSELRHELLGPDEPNAMQRFSAAVDVAYARATSRLAGRASNRTS